MDIKRLVIITIVMTTAVSACKFREEHKETAQKTSAMIRTDDESISDGKLIFESKCGFCHSSNSTEMISGPGLLGVLKKSRLPVSKRAATPENIMSQMKTPYRAMPSFAYLSEDEMRNIVAYLNTL